MRVCTLRTESLSSFLDKSGRGRNLCRHPQQFILSMLQIQIFLRRQSNRYRSIHCVCLSQTQKKGEYYEPVKQAGIFVSAVYLKCNRLETAI